MDLLKIFRTDHDGVRKSHMKNLISVALADGHLDDEEWSLLVTIAQVLQFSPDEIRAIRENQEPVKFVPPKKYEDKVQQIYDLVAMMTVDDTINEKELQLCKRISLNLDLLPQIVDDVIANAFQPAVLKR
jgi:uncharacterized tellurite resistance protein B-like protein